MSPAHSDHAIAPPVVLVVDDQQIVCATLRHMLREERDIAFHHCVRSEEAVATAERLAPSIILQDLVMPGIDGLDLLPRYRAHPSLANTPIVVLSAEEEPKVKAEAFRRGANDYMVKPPDRVELIARIRYHSRAYRLLLRAEAMHEAEKQKLIADKHAATVRSRDTLIFALAKLAESRDTDTGEHLERIAAYSRLLAEQLRSTHTQLSDEWVLHLQVASSLHDIGKVGIPDAVLLKPGKLEPEERKVMERHPKIGADALDAILARSRAEDRDEMLCIARNITASHHERWDGKGYPDGLAGEAIPLEARIVSVADVYDALTSKRVYKPAMSHEQAMKIITEGRGTQFDPAVVDALARCEAVFSVAAPLLHGQAPDATPPTGAAA